MHSLIAYFKSLGIDPNVTISLTLSLATFSLGFLFNWLSRSIARHRENNWYRKSFRFTLANFSRSCQIQYTQVTASLETASVLENRNFEIKAVPITSIDYLAKTDFNRFVMAFHPRWYYGTKSADGYLSMISKLFRLIEKIKSQEEAVRKLMDVMGENYRRHEQIYIDNLQNIHTAIGDVYRSRTAEQLQFDQAKIILKEYTDVLNNWIKDGSKTGYLNTYPQIVLNILKLNDKYPFTDFCEQTNRPALACQLAYQNVEKIDVYMQAAIGTYAFNNKKAAKLTQWIGERL